MFTRKCQYSVETIKLTTSCSFKYNKLTNVDDRDFVGIPERASKYTWIFTSILSSEMLLRIEQLLSRTKVRQFSGFKLCPLYIFMQKLRQLRTFGRPVSIINYTRTQSNKYHSELGGNTRTYKLGCYLTPNKLQNLHSPL